MEINITNANEYFTNRINSEIWFEQTETQKQAALTTAKEKIYHLPFLGTKSEIKQSEPFPRIYKSMYLTMPDDVVKGVFEEALSLIKKNISSDTVDIPEGIASMSLGNASVTFKGNSGGTFSDITKNSMVFLEGWLQKGYDLEQQQFREDY